MVGLIILATGREATPQRNYLWSDPAIDSGGYRGTYTLLLEETPKWHSVFDEYNQLNSYTPVKTEKGDFAVKSIVRKTNYHQIEVQTPQGGILSEKTHFWPGWKILIDGKPAQLYDPYHPYSHGLLTFDVPAGIHIIEAKLTEPLLNQLANVISLISLLAAGIMFAGKCLKKAY